MCQQITIIKYSISLKWTHRYFNNYLNKKKKRAKKNYNFHPNTCRTYLYSRKLEKSKTLLMCRTTISLSLSACLPHLFFLYTGHKWKIEAFVCAVGPLYILIPKSPNCAAVLYLCPIANWLYLYPDTRCFQLFPSTIWFIFNLLFIVLF